MITEFYTSLTFPQGEALRYLGIKASDPQTLAILEEVRSEAEAVLSPAVCRTEVDVIREGETLLLGTVKTESKALIRNLSGCERAVVFAATVGIGIDRLLLKYGRTDVLKCAVLQAVGAAYAESLCDEVCAKLATEKQGLFLRPRFSPGYGDFPLQAQTDLFRLLSPEKRIGVTLNESLLMSPSKSVTAIVGLSPTPCRDRSRCEDCGKKDCHFRNMS